jgi:hypothetical protein
LTNPDGTNTGLTIYPNDDGEYSTVLQINSEYELGEYGILSSYNSKILGKEIFSIQLKSQNNYDVPIVEPTPETDEEAIEEFLASLPTVEEVKDASFPLHLQILQNYGNDQSWLVWQYGPYLHALVWQENLKHVVQNLNDVDAALETYDVEWFRDWSESRHQDVPACEAPNYNPDGTKNTDCVGFFNSNLYNADGLGHWWKIQEHVEKGMSFETAFDKENKITEEIVQRYEEHVEGFLHQEMSLGIASFVDQTKDPQHYIDRYNNEPTYKQWFDDNYSQYDSIYQAVGLDEPSEESVLETPVEPEPAIISEQEYTPEPVFSPDPVVEQEVNCGPGTELVNDVCQAIPNVNSEQKVNCGPGTESVNGICQVIQTEESGGCLIATATYGSEMATQVQQLRELRDSQLLQTESGAAFMGTFNDIYYSFSPMIADYERENPLFKEAVKLAITPMISTLSLMENAESESEVLSIGISVIMLNLGMYLGVPAIVVVGIRKRF